MAHAFFLGVDVTEANAESSNGAAGEETAGAVTLTLLEKEKNGDGRATFRLDSIRHTEGVPDPGDVADHVQSLVASSPYIGRTSIVINTRPGAGEAVAGALEDRGLAPVRATLSGGMGATAGDTDEVGVHLSEYDAVETLAGLYRRGDVKFEDHASSDVSRLARGIQSFVEHLADVEEATEAPDTVERAPQRPESFDDYVTSAALAAWLASERSFDPSQHLKEEPQTEVPNL